MTREDLFLAIGQVESSRLFKSELPSMQAEEDKTMYTKPKRTLRNLLIAAVIVSMLAVTAYAAMGYLIFDSPEDMISTIFGDKTGFDHSDGSIRPDPYGPPSGIIVEPTYDRVPADEDVVASEAAPLVDAVGQSISWEGYTLTVDANLYDSVTKCGMVTYLLENPNGLHYDVQSDGEVWFPGGEIVTASQYGRSYIIQDKSSDTKLSATYYYQLRNPNTTDIEIGFTQWASTTQEQIDQRIEEIKQELRQEIPEEEALAYRKMSLGDQWPWFEENRTREENIDSAYEDWAYERLEEVTICPDTIIIPEAPQGEMSNITLGNGAVTISPIAATIRKQEIENLGYSFMGLFKIRFADGSEYVVQDGYIENRVFAVTDSEETELTYMFNRIIDVNEVVSVIVDGDVELPLDK